MRFCVWNPRVHRENVSISERRLLTYGCETRREIEYKQKDLWCGHRRIPFPWWGMMRRLRRGSGTCRPMGRSHFSFDGERKVCKRKPAARHYGKKPFIAHFDGGARNVARNFVGELPPTFARAPVLPFSAVKMGGLFSLRCLTPLCSLAVGTGRTQIAVLGSYSAAWRLHSAEKQTLFFPLQLAQGMLNQCQLGCCDMP